MKGNKRFKTLATNDAASKHLSSLDEYTVDDAKKIYSKLNAQTSYAKTFGEKPKAQEEFLVLK